MKKPRGARTANGEVARRRRVEARLLTELCSDHGYTFADSLKNSDRTTMMMYKRNGKRVIEACPVVKLIVPSDSEFGRQIAKFRKERDPRTSKSAVARKRAAAKMRPLAKIGAGPS